MQNLMNPITFNWKKTIGFFPHHRHEHMNIKWFLKLRECTLINKYTHWLDNGVWEEL